MRQFCSCHLFGGLYYDLDTHIYSVSGSFMRNPCPGTSVTVPKLTQTILGPREANGHWAMLGLRAVLVGTSRLQNKIPRKVHLENFNDKMGTHLHQMIVLRCLGTLRLSLVASRVPGRRFPSICAALKAMVAVAVVAVA